METSNERAAREWETPEIMSTIRADIVRQNVMGVTLSEFELDRFEKFTAELKRRGVTLPDRRCS